MENIEDVKNKIRNSIKYFINEQDRDFLMRIKIHEITLSHRIAIYLEKNFLKLGYIVDCEYNKNMGNSKRDDKGSKIRPDIIIHKRNSDDNIAIFEIKKAGKKDKRVKDDIKKLKKCSNLNYKIGVVVGILKRRIDLVWIEKNKEEFETIKI